MKDPPGWLVEPVVMFADMTKEDRKAAAARLRTALEALWSQGEGAAADPEKRCALGQALGEWVSRSNEQDSSLPPDPMERTRERNSRSPLSAKLT